MSDQDSKPASLLGTAQRINDALDAERWDDAARLATGALEDARASEQPRWAERFERLLAFARARGKPSSPAPPESSRVTCSFCTGGLNGDRYVAGLDVFICSGCLKVLCEARAREQLAPGPYWTFVGDAGPTALKCIFCALTTPLFIGRPGGICSGCLSIAASALDPHFS